MLNFLQLSSKTLLPLLLLTIVLIKCLSSTKKTLLNIPPSPSKLPIIGNFHQLGKFPYRSLRSLARKHGQLMLLQLGRVPVLVATSPTAAEEIMKTHDLIFSSRPKLTIPYKLLYQGKDVTFAPHGEYWRQVKSIAVSNLLSNTRVQSYKGVRVEEINLLIWKIMKVSNENKVVNLGEMLKTLTNDVVSRVALGRKNEGEEGRRLRELIADVNELAGVFCIGDYVPWLWWIDRVNGLLRRVERVAKEIDVFLEGVVNDHLEKKKKEESEGKDFVDILLEIQRQNTLGFPVSRDTLKALVLVLPEYFAASADTMTHHKDAFDR